MFYSIDFDSFYLYVLCTQKYKKHGGIIRSGAKLLFAYAEATVPKITVCFYFFLIGFIEFFF